MSVVTSVVGFHFYRSTLRHSARETVRHYHKVTNHLHHRWLYIGEIPSSDDSDAAVFTGGQLNDQDEPSGGKWGISGSGRSNFRADPAKLPTFEGEGCTWKGNKCSNSLLTTFQLIQVDAIMKIGGDFPFE